MRVVTADEMQRIDRKAIEDYGLPGEVLMGLAGKAVFDFIVTRCPSKRRFAIFCGTGNNGGDGFVVAYWLKNSGRLVEIFLAGSPEKISRTAALYENLCRKSGIQINVITDASREIPGMDRFDMVIDAILGTGFTGSPRDPVAGIISAINQSGKTVLSVDMPSGLSSEGRIGSLVVRADYTVTIGLPKINLATFPGRGYAGEVHVADIGFPAELTGSQDLKVSLVDDDYIGGIQRPCIDPDDHKASRGHLLVAGGFDGLEGAALMCSAAALETGVGLATLITTKSARLLTAGRFPELMTFGMDIDASGNPDPSLLSGILDEFFSARKFDALVIGPGLGRTEAAAAFFKLMISRAPAFGVGRIIIDGDGLYFLARYLEEGPLPERTEFLLTPHFKEASRILGTSVDEIKADRIEAARSLACKTGTTVVLKGPASIISDGTQTLINTTGNPLLATGGTGDLLAGITGALCLRDFPVLECASLAAYVHGRAADLLREDNNTGYMKATDILSYIRQAWPFTNEVQK